MQTVKGLYEAHPNVTLLAIGPPFLPLPSLFSALLLIGNEDRLPFV